MEEQEIRDLIPSADHTLLVVVDELLSWANQLDAENQSVGQFLAAEVRNRLGNALIHGAP